jgi:hypothetical protein
MGMISIDIPYRRDDPKSVDLDRIPGPVLKAITTTRQEYPEIDNERVDKPYPKFWFDRLFEELYNCRIEYKGKYAVDRIVWDNDRDYTVFLLRWS